MVHTAHHCKLCLLSKKMGPPADVRVPLPQILTQTQKVITSLPWFEIREMEERREEERWLEREGERGERERDRERVREGEKERQREENDKRNVHPEK